jgi:hypothetical protein
MPRVGVPITGDAGIGFAGAVGPFLELSEQRARGGGITLPQGEDAPHVKLRPVGAMQAVAVMMTLGRQLRAAQRRLLQLPALKQDQCSVGDSERGSIREQLDELNESLDRGHGFVQPAQPAQALDPRHRGKQQCETGRRCR